MADPILFDGSTRLTCYSIICLTMLVASATVNGKAEAAQSPEDSGPPWSYSGDSGPEHWGDLDATYETCVKGQSQSPINLSRTQGVAYTPLAFHYRSQLLEAVNHGHGVRIISPPGSALLIRGDAYDLEEFTFHVPGEHGFDGVTAAAEIQLVHRDPQGGYVVVAVPLREGERENPMLSRILEYLPMHSGERVRQRQVGINPIFLLPSDRSYFRYTGSLATPPCTESVLWLVMREPLEVSRWQIQRIAQAVGTNARPLQPLNGRPVFSFYGVEPRPHLLPDALQALSPAGGEGTGGGRLENYLLSGAASGASFFGLTLTMSSLSSTTALLRISPIFSAIFWR